MLVERGSSLLGKTLEFKRGYSYGNYQELDETRGLPTQETLVHSLKEDKRKLNEFSLVDNTGADRGMFAILKNSTKQI